MHVNENTCRVHETHDTTPCFQSTDTSGVSDLPQKQEGTDSLKCVLRLPSSQSQHFREDAPLIGAVPNAALTLIIIFREGKEKI